MPIMKGVIKTSIVCMKLCMFTAFTTVACPFSEVIPTGFR